MQIPMMMPLYQGGQAVAWHTSCSLSLSRLSHFFIGARQRPERDSRVRVRVRVRGESGSQPLTVVDLGATYALDTIHVWNYNESSATYGMKDVAISVSSTTDTNDLVTLTTNGTGDTDDGSGGFLFPQGFNSDYFGFNVDLSSLTDSSPLDGVRLVKIANTTTYGGNGAGLAEVHFGGEAWVSPPSGTVIMVR